MLCSKGRAILINVKCGETSTGYQVYKLVWIDMEK